MIVLSEDTTGQYALGNGYYRLIDEKNLKFKLLAMSMNVID